MSVLQLACLRRYSQSCNPITLRSDRPFPPRPVRPGQDSIQCLEVKVSPKSNADNFAEDSRVEARTRGVDEGERLLACIGLCGEFTDMTNTLIGSRAWSGAYHADEEVMAHDLNSSIWEYNAASDRTMSCKFGPDDAVGCGVE